MTYCKFDGCLNTNGKRKKARYNFEGLIPKFCVLHKHDGMIDITHKKCLKCNKKQPNFNKEGETKALYCGDCKQEDMIDVINKKCLKCKTKIPSFNKEGETKALYCGDCKTEDMIDVISKKCIICKTKRPVFNKEGEKDATHCKKCKQKDMIDVISKKCLKCNKKRPVFNKEGEKSATHCGNCKEEDMIDVKNPKCLKCKTKIPSFNKEGETKALYCGNCKQEDMIDVKNKKCLKCKTKRPVFNKEGETKALYCGNCKKEDMIDVINKRCITELCDIQISNPKYKGYCLRCFIYTFPDEPITRNYKSKEYSIIEFIKENFEKYEFIYNKRIQNGISKRMPDLLLNLENQVLIIEVDENQHEKYDCSCENKRLMELSLDVEHKSIVFIRFNPDSYLDKEGKKIKSCWSITKSTGIIKIDNKKKWDERLTCLKETVQYWIENETDKTIEVVELYYNQNL